MTTGSPPSRTSLRLGFAGVGWIGRHRLQAMAATGRLREAVIYDPCEAASRTACDLATTRARPVAAFEDLLDQNLDGLVIATPSALHADQARQGLEAGLAVFCQKPLARTLAETRQILDAARRADRLLGVDFSYRFTLAAKAIRELTASGRTGEVFAVDLTFHNAYGPDKAWFYQPSLSGGGCLMDLGVHLVDLLFWLLGPEEPTRVSSRLFAGGEALGANPKVVEDAAFAELHLASGAIVRLACSWRLHAGKDAEIAVRVFGRRGGAEMLNLEGSFYDFEAARLEGPSREILVRPPDLWGGRAAEDWIRRLAEGEGFDADGAGELERVARTLDRIYGR